MSRSVLAPSSVKNLPNEIAAFLELKFKPRIKLFNSYMYINNTRKVLEVRIVIIVSLGVRKRILEKITYSWDLQE